MSDGYYEYADFRNSASDAIKTLLYHWRQNCAVEVIDEWELEIRLGSLHLPQSQRSWQLSNQNQALALVCNAQMSFDTTVEPMLFLALFDYFCKSRDVAVSTSTIDYVETHPGYHKRTLHYESAHAVDRCLTTEKIALTKPQCYKGDRSGVFDFKIAASTEQLYVVPGRECVRMVWPPANVTKRQRRRLVFCDADCWHVDFTRVGDGMRHQIEIELFWPAAFVRTNNRYEALRKNKAGLIERVDFETFFAFTLANQLVSIIARIDRQAASIERVRRIVNEK